VVRIKYTILLSLSAITNIESCPDLVLGKWVMKSIRMDIHGRSGMANGCSKPDGGDWLDLLRWQEFQERMYLRTVLSRCGQ
jgi:hypothetical protein